MTLPKPDAQTGQPHLYKHNLAESEVEEVLDNPGEGRPGEPAFCLSAPQAQNTPMKSTFPPGWNEERVERVLTHYASQSEDEAVAEDGYAQP